MHDVLCRQQVHELGLEGVKLPQFGHVGELDGIDGAVLVLRQDQHVDEADGSCVDQLIAIGARDPGLRDARRVTHYWFHAIGACSIALIVELVDLSYPFSGDLAISSDPFKTGALAQLSGGDREACRAIPARVGSCDEGDAHGRPRAHRRPKRQRDD